MAVATRLSEEDRFMSCGSLATSGSELTETTSSRSPLCRSRSRKLSVTLTPLCVSEVRWPVRGPLDGRGYEVGKTIGRSARNTGFEVVLCTKNAIQYAAKVCREGTNDGVLCDILRNEYRMLKNIQHPNIVEAHALIEGDVGAALVMEFCPGYRVGKLLRAASFRVRDRVHVLTKVLHAISHLHGLQVAHRDIQGDNILVSTSEQDLPSVKVVDFGSSRRHTNEQVILDQEVDPEIIPCSCDLDAESMFTFDVFAVGLLAAGLLERRRISGNEICGSREPDLIDKFSKLSLASRTFLMALLDLDPKTRFTSGEALNAIAGVREWLLPESACVS